MQVRLAEAGERSVAVELLVRQWGDPIVVRSQVYLIGACDLFIAGDFAGLAAVSGRDRPIAELVAITAFTRLQGIGTAMLRSIVDKLERFELLRLATTNDNLDALRFYQRRGFRLQALRPGAVDAARAQKPTISAVGEHGIPIRDELDLTLDLRTFAGPLR
ncbi:MAG TPA: GNAT family N-acetyltransferase [Acetobacteraceae bacterium]|jgi:GNAT superfamily N-acetyltransferase